MNDSEYLSNTVIKYSELIHLCPYSSQNNFIISVTREIIRLCFLVNRFLLHTKPHGKATASTPGCTCTRFEVRSDTDYPHTFLHAWLHVQISYANLERLPRRYIIRCTLTRTIWFPTPPVISDYFLPNGKWVLTLHKFVNDVSSVTYIVAAGDLFWVLCVVTRALLT
jgi:hypothetical protein